MPAEASNARKLHFLLIGSLGRFIYILDIQILVHTHFDLVSLPLALETTQMAPELINNHVISVQQKRYV